MSSEHLPRGEFESLPEEEKKRWFSAALPEFLSDLYRYALHLTRDQEAAWDLLQSVLLRAWQKLPLLKHEAGLGGWLRRMLFRVHLNLQAQKRQTVSLDAAGLDPHDRRRGEDLHAVLGQRSWMLDALEQLPPDSTLREFYSDYLGVKGEKKFLRKMGYTAETIASRVQGLQKYIWDYVDVYPLVACERAWVADPVYGPSLFPGASKKQRLRWVRDQWSLLTVEFGCLPAQQQGKVLWGMGKDLGPSLHPSRPHLSELERSHHYDLATLCFFLAGKRWPGRLAEAAELAMACYWQARGILKGEDHEISRQAAHRDLPQAHSVPHLERMDGYRRTISRLLKKSGAEVIDGYILVDEGEYEFGGLAG